MHFGLINDIEFVRVLLCLKAGARTAFRNISNSLYSAFSKRTAKRMKACVRLSFTCGLAALSGLILLAPSANAYEATNNYTKANINGWVVYISPEFDSKPKDRKAIVSKVRSQTAVIAQTLSAKHLKTLRKSNIWIEAQSHYRALARYHATKGEIYQEDLNVEKYRDVEIFGNFAHRSQPSLVLHELAHAYHDRKLSKRNSRVRRLFSKFETGASTAKDHCGKATKAYALKNEGEFFASFTESFFTETCTYPYNRETIQRRHPQMYALLVKTWGS